MRRSAPNWSALRGTYAGDPLLATLLLAIGGDCHHRVHRGRDRGRRRRKAGRGLGARQHLLQVGTALGIATLMTLAATRTEALVEGGTEAVSAFDKGFAYSFLAGAVITAVGALVVLLLMRRWTSVPRATAGRSRPWVAWPWLWNGPSPSRSRSHASRGTGAGRSASRSWWATQRRSSRAPGRSRLTRCAGYSCILHLH